MLISTRYAQEIANQRNMDTSTIFRSLVTNTYIPGSITSLLICHSKLFSTILVILDVWRLIVIVHVDSNMNTWIISISESGEINEVLYEKIVQSIIDGKCPHVEQVPKEYIQETGIYALHVAAALGTTEAIVTPSDQRFFFFNNVNTSPESLTGDSF